MRSIINTYLYKYLLLMRCIFLVWEYFKANITIFRFIDDCLSGWRLCLEAQTRKQKIYTYKDSDAERVTGRMSVCTMLCPDSLQTDGVYSAAVLCDHGLMSLQ